MADTHAGQPYPPMVGLIFVFNLIVGTGALAMPKAFVQAGWLNSLILVCLLAFTGFVTATFVIEAMSIANAFTAYDALITQGPGSHSAPSDPDDDVSRDRVDINTGAASDDEPLLDEHTPKDAGDDDLPIDVSSEIFEIKERMEMGKMASMFYHWDILLVFAVGVITFYCCISIYLYGDLAIYAAAVPKSFRNVACTFTHSVNHTDLNVTHATHASTSCDGNLTDTDPCWPSLTFTRGQAYRIFVAVFAVTIGSFVFFNVQKTSVLQYFTSIMRWLAFATMIILCVIKLAKGQGQGEPKVAEFKGLPTLFGVCVYSFMCHHSLPTLITPITNKSRVFTLMGTDYIMILIFYSLLSFTGIFTFSSLQDIYTLNFLCDTDVPPITTVKFLEYFLALFPVFTLSTNFPIIAISLRNNIKTLCHQEGKPPHHWFVDRIAFPLITICPPILVAFVTDNVEFLVSITGSYAGASIQYFIPVGLVFFARRKLNNHGVLSGVRNRYTSPFRHVIWLLVIFIWAVIAVILVTINHVIQGA